MNENKYISDWFYLHLLIFVLEQTKKQLSDSEEKAQKLKQLAMKVKKELEQQKKQVWNKTSKQEKREDEILEPGIP